MIALARQQITTQRLPDAPGQTAHVTVPHGLTVGEIVEIVLPGVSLKMRSRMQVWLCAEGGETLLAPTAWRARPKVHARVVIRIAPGKKGLGAILSIVVAVAAAWLAPVLAGTLLGTSAGFGFTVASSAIQIGLNLLGGLLINSLFGADAAGGQSEKPTYAITGYQNEIRRSGPIPVHMGRVRVAPTWAHAPVMEVEGDDAYVRGALLWGRGRLAVSELKIKDTPLADYEGVLVEHRYGLPDDEPLTLLTGTTIQSSEGVSLVRPIPRDEYGEPIDDAEPEAKPVTRRAARDAERISLIFSFPYGLKRLADDGTEISKKVEIAIRQRLWGALSWSDVTTLVFEEEKSRPFYREHGWAFPERGDWEIELEMMTPEATSSSVAAEVQLVALKSWRPEYPIAYAKPLALTGIRVKSSYQLNGPLDAVNGVVDSVSLDFVPDGPDDGEWVEQATRWPPALALLALRGDANPFPVADGRIDWPAFEAWHRFCVLHELRYDRTHDFREPLKSTLKAIGAAGRAVVFDNGSKWTVVIDDPRNALPVAHLSARNCSEIRGRIEYLKLPHAIVAPFRDRTSGYEPKDMVIPFPGHEGPVNLTEKVDRPWITEPVQLFRDIRRYQLELLHRAVTFSAIQQRSVRQASLGDKVIASRDFFARGTHSARVTRVDGSAVMVDDTFTIEPDQDYWLRYIRHFLDDPQPHSILRAVTAAAGETQLLTLVGTGTAPIIGGLVHLVPATAGGMELILTRIERGREPNSVLSLRPAAGQIDDILDETVVPEWTGRSGFVLDGPGPTPGAPEILRVATGLAATDTADGLKVFLLAGVTNGAILDRFELRHRLVGAGTWEPLLDVPAATAMFDLTGLYAVGNDVELEARSVSIDGQESAFTTTVTVTVGALDGPAPGALPAGTVTVENGTGAFTIVVDTSLADTETARVRLYVNAGGALDEDDDFVGSVAADGTEYRRVRNLPASSYQVFARPVNALGAPGPVLGPIPATSS